MNNEELNNPDQFKKPTNENESNDQNKPEGSSEITGEALESVAGKLEENLNLVERGLAEVGGQAGLEKALSTMDQEKLSYIQQKMQTVLESLSDLKNDPILRKLAGAGVLVGPLIIFLSHMGVDESLSMGRSETYTYATGLFFDASGLGIFVASAGKLIKDTVSYVRNSFSLASLRKQEAKIVN